MSSDNKRELSPVELMGELYSRQGYFVVYAKEEQEIGTQNGLVEYVHTGAQVESPMRIVALSSREEYLQQRALAKQLMDYGDLEPLPQHARYFYRVEALD